MKFHLNIRDPKQDAVYRERVNEERRKYREKRARQERQETDEAPVVVEILSIDADPMKSGGIALMISGKDMHGEYIGVGAILHSEHIEALQRLGEIAAD